MQATLTAADFAASFGCDVDALPNACLELIDQRCFDYEALEGKQRDQVILDVLKRMGNDTQVIAAQSRKDVWHKGWAENLDAYIKSGESMTALTPKFIRADRPLRWRRRYIASPNPMFELDFITVFRLWLYTTFFQGFTAAHEFGCGTGFNLVALGQVYPHLRLQGLDFVQSSVDLTERIAASEKLSLTARLFDMTRPDPSVCLEPQDIVLTFGAVEQLGLGYVHFLDYLLRQNAGRHVHVEPTIELYDEECLEDYLAASFHRKRGYTTGLLPRLRELDEQGVVRLEKVKRLEFGSMMMEGYTLIVWSKA